MYAGTKRRAGKAEMDLIQSGLQNLVLQNLVLQTLVLQTVDHRVTSKP
jgi:hypothetical protein